MNKKSIIASTIFCVVVLLIAGTVHAFVGTWATQNGKITITRSGNTLKGSYQNNARSSENFNFTCTVANERNAGGNWAFADPGKGAGRGPISLTLQSGNQMRIVMKYSNGNPMADYTVTKIPPPVFVGTWATQNGKITITRSGNTLKGSYQNNARSSENFNFTGTVANERNAGGNWAFADPGKGAGRGPISLTLLSSDQMRIVMKYANGSPMADYTVKRVR